MQIAYIYVLMEICVFIEVNDWSQNNKSVFLVKKFFSVENGYF